MNNNLLPIGTVVQLHDNKRKYIVLGTFCKFENKIYTYYCCMYPYGLIIDNEEINKEVKNYDVYINQEDIENIVFLGNVNREV